MTHPADSLICHQNLLYPEKSLMDFGNLILTYRDEKQNKIRDDLKTRRNTGNATKKQRLWMLELPGDPVRQPLHIRLERDKGYLPWARVWGQEPSAAPAPPGPQHCAWGWHSKI